MMAVEDRAAAAASRAGVEAAEVERLPFDLSGLEADGILVDVDCEGFARLTVQLGWESLGVTLPEGAQRQIKAPSMLALPHRYAKRLLSSADAARQALSRYGFRFSLVETVLGTPAYRWIPWQAWEGFEGQFGHARGMLDEARAELLADYEAVRLEVTAMLATLADGSARRLTSTNAAVPADYRERVVTEGLARMPTETDVREGLRLRYRVGVLHLGSEMLAERRAAAEERARLSEIEAAANIQRERERLQTRAERTRLWAEEESARRKLRATEDEIRREAAVKERLRQIKVAAAREQVQQALSPLREGIQQLHATIYQEAEELRATVEKRGHVPGSTATRIRTIASSYRSMNWTEDAALGELVNRLEALAEKPASGQARDLGAIQGTLSEIVRLTQQAAREAARSGRFAALEI